MYDYDNVVEYDFDDVPEDDDLDYLLDAIEDDDDEDDIEFLEDDDDDAAERRRRRRRSRRRARRASRAKGKGYYQRTLKGYATKKQLSEALARVGRDVRRNKSGITNNSRRISSLSRSTSSAIKKVTKETDNIKQMTMLMSLLGGDKKYKVADSSNPGQVPNDVTFTLKDESDSLDKLLPFVMMGGMGGSKGGMMDNPLMMVLMLDALKD